MDSGSGVEPSLPRNTTKREKPANDALNGFLSEAYQVGESVDRRYGVPARRKIVTIGGIYPFTTALGLVFAALAFFPVLTFLGFSLFILISFLSTALVTVLVLSGTIILAAGALFLAVVSLAFGFALFLTISGFMAYITYRLLFHVREGQGVGAWRAETVTRFGLVDVAGVRGALASSGPKTGINGKMATE